MKKIMFYISSIGDGGAQRVVANLSNQFFMNNYEVILITEKQRDREYVINNSIKRYFLNSDTAYRNRFFKNVSWIRRLRKICKCERPDVLVSFMAEPNFRAVIATFCLKTKCIISVRNDPNREYTGKIGRFLGKTLLPFADGCVFQTQQAKSWFPIKLQKKSAIIYNAVDPVFYSTSWSPQNGLAVACGRLNKQKNYYVMIDAVKEVYETGRSINLNVYGVGEEESAISDYIVKNGMSNIIKLKGRTDDVSNVLKNANIFLLSSDYEGMPNALMEACAVGVPSVSTDCPCGGPNEILKNNAGILVPVNDSHEFAKAIISIIDDTVYAEQISKNAKERALQYLPNKVFGDWEKYLLRISCS